MAREEFDFSAAMREAEAAAGVENPYPTGVPEGEPDTPVILDDAWEGREGRGQDLGEEHEAEQAERERNEKGQFVARADGEPAEPEAPTLDEPPDGETAAEQAERLYAGRYKTVEELERAVIEKEQFAQRQGNEVGELRRIVEQLAQAQATPQYVAPPAYATDALEERILDNPQVARQYAADALQRGDWDGYERIIGIWGQTEDQFSALRYDQQVQNWRLATQVQAQIGQVAAPIEQDTQARQLAQAVRTATHHYQDFDQIVGSTDEQLVASIGDAIDKGFPRALVAQLQGGDATGKFEALDTLYRWRKAEQTGTLNEAAKQAVARQAEEARDAKRKATVASATTTSPAPEPVDEAKRMAQAWDDSRILLKSGWKGRDSRR